MGVCCCGEDASVSPKSRPVTDIHASVAAYPVCCMRENGPGCLAVNRLEDGEDASPGQCKIRDRKVHRAVPQWEDEHPARQAEGSLDLNWFVAPKGADDWPLTC